MEIENVWYKFWPGEVLDAFENLVAVAQRHSMAVMFAVALDCQNPIDPKVAIQISEHTAENPALAEMFRDMGQMFTELAEEYKAVPKPRPN